MPFSDRTDLATHGVDAIAAKVLRQLVPLQQVTYPGVLRLGLLAEWAGLEQGYLESGIQQQQHDLFGRIFAIVARLRLRAISGWTNVGRKKSRMITFQDRPNRTQRSNVRSSEHQMSAGLQNP